VCQTLTRLDCGSRSWGKKNCDIEWTLAPTKQTSTLRYRSTEEVVTESSNVQSGTMTPFVDQVLYSGRPRKVWSIISKFMAVPD
jgi:hypothetical protein